MILISAQGVGGRFQIHYIRCLKIIAARIQSGYKYQIHKASRVCLSVCLLCVHAFLAPSAANSLWLIKVPGSGFSGVDVARLVVCRELINVILLFPHNHQLEHNKVA